MAVVSEKVIYYSNSNSNNNDNNKNYYSLTSSCAVQTKIHGHGSDHRSHGSSLCSCGDYANADKTSQRYLGLGLPFALFKTKFVHYHQVLKLIFLHDMPKEL